MAKIRNCYAEMIRQAKVGKMCGSYAVHADEVKQLEAAGFTVTLPKKFHVDGLAQKNAREVEISWEKPTKKSGLAMKLHKMVNKYRRKCNSFQKAVEMKNQKTGAMTVNWISTLNSDDIEETNLEEDYFYDYGDELDEN